MTQENKYRKIASDAIDNKSNKTPIYKGCDNKQCFCTGACKEIIGYVDKINSQKHFESPK